MNPNIVYVGVKAQVAAVDKATGKTLWQTKLKGGLTSGERFVTLLVEEGHVYAHTYGELFCLDAETGEILWQNALEGLGYDIVSLASEGSSSLSPAALAFRRAQRSGSAGVIGAGDGATGHH